LTRIYKFRAWDKKKKKFIVSPFLFVQWNDELKLAGFDGADEPYPLEDIELIQFTGLKDKNGKDIHEGDLLDFFEEIYEVKWCGSQYVALWLKEDIQTDIEECIMKGCEVVGNRFENPELLKGKQ